MKGWVKAASLVAAACVVGGLLLLNSFGKPEAPAQPIEFDHHQHVKSEEGPQLDCSFCHEHADKSSAATIPNTSTCMICHEAIKAESPEVRKLASLHAEGRQPEWRRVYWFEPSANAYFTHKPHVRAGLDCAACHGQVGEMRRVRREVNQTMGWCIDCHRESRVSIDCYVCHR
jgi:Cytochrome c7 and related cytochrome c